jgi:hypothetical protein
VWIQKSVIIQRWGGKGNKDVPPMTPPAMAPTWVFRGVELRPSIATVAPTGSVVVELTAVVTTSPLDNVLNIQHE